MFAIFNQFLHDGYLNIFAYFDVPTNTCILMDLSLNHAVTSLATSQITKGVTTIEGCVMLPDHQVMLEVKLATTSLFVHEI